METKNNEATAKATEPMAILAFIFAFIFAPLAIVFGVLGRRNVDRNSTAGRGFATAGMWMGIVFTSAGLAYIIVILIYFSRMQ